MKNRIAMKIQEARLKAKMTEKELAKKCGLTANYIIQIESGKKVINEKVAENILKVLGEKPDILILEASAEERNLSKPVEKPKKEKEVEFYDIKPTEQWSDALANIIKKFPIYEVSSNKVVGYKELPVLGKKVEGYNWDKILFVQATDNEMEGFRINKNDIIMVQLTNEIQNNSIYLFEMANKKMIRQLRKESNNKVVISTGAKEKEPMTTDLSKIKIIGKCVKVEFALK